MASPVAPPTRLARSRPPAPLPPQMAAGIEEVATNATQVATASQQAKIVAERGGQAVRETTAAMAEIQLVVGQAASKVRELGTLGQKIGAVVETIDDIAEQTNLLALNAAIEAARAGEHGKGFAVVADEVRKLAERSGRETKQIAELIAQVQTGTKDAVGAMDSGAAKVELGSQKAAQAGQALDEILAAVQDTVRQVGEIASSSQEMAGGARSVTDAMQSISAVVEESSAATEEMAAQASAVTGSIQSIAAVSEQQSAATEEVSARTEEMSAQVEQMSAQAQELAATAEQLKALVARFKLDDHATPASAGCSQASRKDGDAAAPRRLRSTWTGYRVAWIQRLTPLAGVVAHQSLLDDHDTASRLGRKPRTLRLLTFRLRQLHLTNDQLLAALRISSLRRA